jgi:hypothetical protein
MRDQTVPHALLTHLKASLIRKRGRNDSDETKWKRMYRIIFDLDESAETPSPYFDRMQHVVSSTSEDSEDKQTFAAFRQWLDASLAQEIEPNKRNVLLYGLECVNIFQGSQKARSGSSKQVEPELEDSSNVSHIKYSQEGRSQYPGQYGGLEIEFLGFPDMGNTNYVWNTQACKEMNTDEWGLTFVPSLTWD